MPIVVDLARPLPSNPTRDSGNVRIIQSQTEPHVEAFTTDGTVTPPASMPTEDDRKHLTGSDVP